MDLLLHNLIEHLWV